MMINKVTCNEWIGGMFVDGKDYFPNSEGLILDEYGNKHDIDFFKHFSKENGNPRFTITYKNENEKENKKMNKYVVINNFFPVYTDGKKYPIENGTTKNNLGITDNVYKLYEAFKDDEEIEFHFFENDVDVTDKLIGDKKEKKAEEEEKKLKHSIGDIVTFNEDSFYSFDKGIVVEIDPSGYYFVLPIPSETKGKTENEIAIEYIQSYIENGALHHDNVFSAFDRDLK